MNIIIMCHVARSMIMMKKMELKVDKWQKVGHGRKRGTAGSSSSSSKTTGLHHSSAPFSLYSERMEVEEGVEEVIASSKEEAVSNSPSHSGGASSSSKKRGTSKKPKPKKISFEECLEELQPSEIEKMIEAVQESCGDNYVSILKEVQSFLLSAFSKAEPEKDHTFSTKSPGYPLSALPASCRDPLQRVLAKCPQVSLENSFRCCLDSLLGEIKSGSASYGTRIMLFLLIERNSSVCVEAAKMIQLLIQSNISKVPETLSLLWAGLPHPRLHPTASIKCWPDLCLPLFHLDNVPKQVFNYAIECTSLMINRSIEEGNGGMLLEVLSPKVVCALLTSPHLLHKRMQKNVQDLLALVQDAVVDLSTDDQLPRYFKAGFQHLSKSSENILLKFSTRCLQNSGGSWMVWLKSSSDSHASSSLLLKELIKDEQSPPPLTLNELAGIMNQLSRKVAQKDKPQVKELFAGYARTLKRTAGVPVRGEVKEKKGTTWCSVLVILFSILYLAFLLPLLYYISTQGPHVILAEVNRYIDARTVTVAWKTVAYVLDQFCSTLLHFIPMDYLSR